MKVKEIAKEAKQKKDKKRKFPCILQNDGCYSKFVVFAVDKYMGYVMIGKDADCSVGEPWNGCYNDHIEWAMYEGELRLYN